MGMTLEFIKQGPPGRVPHTLEYEVDGDVLTVTHTTYHPDGTPHRVEIDGFDFTDLPDGEVDAYDIETNLPVMAVQRARRVDGDLTVTVLDWSQD